MAVTSQQIIDFLLANPSMSDAEIAGAMATYGVSPADMAKATGLDEGVVAARVAATLPPNEAVLLGDTYVQAVNQVTGSGQDQQVGGLENVITYKAGENKVGGGYQQYTPTGELERTGTQQEVNAAKDFMDFALTAGTMFGVPAGIGEALGLTGTTAQAVGQGLLTSGTKLGGGANLEDALTAGLLSGGLVYGGSQLSDAVNNLNYDSISAADTAGGLIPKYGTAYDDIIANLVDNPETQQALQDIINGKEVTTSPITNAEADIANVNVTAPASVTTPVNVGDVFTTIPTLTVTDKNLNKDTLDLNSVISLVNSGNLDTSNLVNNVADTTKTTETAKKDDKITTSDVIRLVGAGTTLAAIDAAKQGTDTGTQFPIIPVPEEWTGQPPTVVAPRPKLQPIDFGSRNLLMGTQWEKFLSPTYGQVPTPVQYSQPTNLSYNDLMSILGSKQGMPSASSLSINDIISGIQNQYGQAPTRTMG